MIPSEDKSKRFSIRRWTSDYAESRPSWWSTWNTSRMTKRFTAVHSSVNRILNPDLPTSSRVIAVDPSNLSSIENRSLMDQVAKALQSDPHTPGWTDGHDVFINKNRMPGLTDRVENAALGKWVGMNAHLLGHTMYSPRIQSRLLQLIYGPETQRQYPGLRDIETMVEDQRAERLLIAEYAPLAGYLVSAAAHIIEQRPTPLHPTHLYPTIAGRTWIDSDLRAKMRDIYTGDAEKVERLVGEYQLLADPGAGDSNRAFEILKELWEEVINNAGVDMGEMPGGCSQPLAMPLSKGLGQPAEAEGAPTAGDPDTEGQGKGKGEGQSGQGQGQGDGRGKGDEDEDGDPATGAGRAKRKPISTRRDLVDALSAQALDQMAKDPVLKEDLARIRKSMDEIVPVGSELDRARSNRAREAPPTYARLLAEELTDSLKQFTDQTLPYFERRVDHGRLNVNRYLNRANPYDFDTMFDRFDPGMQDDLSLDVSILIDMSGSMGQPADMAGRRMIDLAIEAAWAIEMAVDACDGQTTVLGYNGTGFLLSDTGTRPSPDGIQYFTAGGGTDPTDALNDTWRRLQTVEAAHAVVVVLSDGDWSDGQGVMKQLTDNGVITVGVMLSSAASDPHWAKSLNDRARELGAAHYACMTHPDGMSRLFSEVVQRRMAEVIEG